MCFVMCVGMCVHELACIDLWGRVGMYINDCQLHSIIIAKQTTLMWLILQLRTIINSIHVF